MKTIAALFTIFLASLSPSLHAAPPRPDYVVRVSATDPRNIDVECRFVAQGMDISLADWGAEHFPEGWGKFVSGLRARGDEGRDIVLTGGPQAWKMAAVKGQAVRLSYRLRVEHDRHVWPHGLDEAAYVKPDAIFLTGMALFVSPDDTAGATVRFELPEGWIASTPWQRGGPASFVVSSGDELLSNALMLGRHEERSFEQAGMRITMAVGGRMKASAAMLENVMKPSVTAYARLFGGVPKSNYLVTLHEGLTDGGAFSRSYSMLASEDLTKANLIDWGHIVAHETLHLWNGTGMRPKVQMDWFKEGFTDYLTIVSLKRLGLIDEALFTKKLESHVRRTLGPHALSLAEAGRDKKNNWAWIYGGGAMAALVLDARLREASGGKRSLDDVMNALFQSHQATPFELADLQRVVDNVAGSDQTAFFRQYVTGKEPLPLRSAFATLGYALVTNTQGEAFLIATPATDDASRAVRQGWAGH